MSRIGRGAGGGEASKYWGKKGWNFFLKFGEREREEKEKKKGKCWGKWVTYCVFYYYHYYFGGEGKHGGLYEMD